MKLNSMNFMMILVFMLTNLSAGLQCMIQYQDLISLFASLCLLVLAIILFVLIWKEPIEIDVIWPMLIIHMTILINTILIYKYFESITYFQCGMGLIIINVIWQNSAAQILKNWKIRLYQLLNGLSFLLEVVISLTLLPYSKDQHFLLLCLIQCLIFSNHLNFEKRQQSGKLITSSEQFPPIHSKLEGIQVQRVYSEAAGLGSPHDMGYKEARSIHIENFSQINSQIPNGELLQGALDVFSEGLFILERDTSFSFPYKVLFMNKAIRLMFSVNNTTEMIDFLIQLPQLQFTQYETENFGKESILFQQKLVSHQIKLCRSFMMKDSLQQRKDSQQNCRDNQIFDKTQQLPLQALLEKMIGFKRNQTLIVHTYLQQSQKSSIYNGDGTMIEFSISITLEKQFIIVARDVTHKQKIKYLKEYNYQKSKMLSFVSHEYRSPLNCIIEMLGDVLLKHKLNQEDEQFIKIALESTHYLLNLSNDLLDLAQIKNSKFDLNITSFNIETLAQDCLNLFLMKSKLKNIALKLDLSFLGTIMVRNDRNRIKQILINLLSNAFKFTRTQIDLVIEVNIDETKLYIGVKDDGIGISEDNQQLLFKAFSKINSEDSKKLNESGVGLGLLISNQIAQQIGSNNMGIQIQSIEGKGSNFFFILDQFQHYTHAKKISSMKLKEVELHEPLITSNDFGDDSQRSLRHSFNLIEQKKTTDALFCQHILVVDDEAFNILVITKKLNKLGINDIDTAANGKEAIEKVKMKKCQVHCSGYKAIFMDIEMPFMNGLKSTEEILKIKPSQIIFGLSGYKGEEEYHKCITAGMKTLLVKPVDDQELFKTLDEFPQF